MREFEQKERVFEQEKKAKSSGCESYPDPEVAADSSTNAGPSYSGEPGIPYDC
jgi:hypothetical protein